MDILKTETRTIALKDLHNNTGQIEGVPSNPRVLRDEHYKRLLQSLKDSNLTGVLPLKVIDYNGEWVVLGGNMRYNNFDLWCEKFYEPLLVSTTSRLKSGGSFFLQVGSQTYPLAARAHEICRKHGFACKLYADDISFSTLGTEDRSDKEVILQIQL